MNKNLTLFQFQEDAVSALVRNFKTLWVSGQQRIPLIFKAPTVAVKLL